jgi:hypothetical protein
LGKITCSHPFRVWRSQWKFIITFPCEHYFMRFRRMIAIPGSGQKRPSLNFVTAVHFVGPKHSFSICSDLTDSSQITLQLGHSRQQYPIFFLILLHDFFLSNFTANCFFVPDTLLSNNSLYFSFPNSPEKAEFDCPLLLTYPPIYASYSSRFLICWLSSLFSPNRRRGWKYIFRWT